MPKSSSRKRTAAKPIETATPAAIEPEATPATATVDQQPKKRGRKSVPADPEYAARHEASRKRTSALYAGFSQSTTRSSRQRPFAIYAQSARSGNGHMPNTYTERDATAVLEAGVLTGFKAGVPYNPGDIGGDKSAHGVRMHGHQYAAFSADGEAFVLTEAGAKRALAEKSRAEARGVAFN